MRKPIIAGNWKMYKTRDEALAFIYAVNEKVPAQEIVDSVICAPFTSLRCLVKRQGENLRIGAQNMHFSEEGAFTGEIAPSMLTSLGVEYVIYSKFISAISGRHIKLIHASAASLF